MGECNQVESIYCLAPPRDPLDRITEPGDPVDRSVGPRVGTCYACGLPVCRNCSLVVAYYEFGRKRICFGCLIDQDVPNAQERIDAFLYKLAGYEETT